MSKGHSDRATRSVLRLMVSLQVEGETDDEKAKSLVRAMLEAGLAEKL